MLDSINCELPVGAWSYVQHVKNEFILFGAQGDFITEEEHSNSKKCEIYWLKKIWKEGILETFESILKSKEKIVVSIDMSSIKSSDAPSVSNVLGGEGFTKQEILDICFLSGKT